MWKPPPMGCVSGRTYPSGLLVDRAPSGPFGAPKRYINTKSAKGGKMAIWGSQNKQKRRTRVKKCGLGDLEAPGRSKLLKTQLCDSDPSEQQKTSYTYAKGYHVGGRFLGASRLAEPAGLGAPGL